MQVPQNADGLCNDNMRRNVCRPNMNCCKNGKPGKWPEQSNTIEIVLSCGFNHLSYFFKVFLREYRCMSPERSPVRESRPPGSGNGILCKGYVYSTKHSNKLIKIPKKVVDRGMCII